MRSPSGRLPLVLVALILHPCLLGAAAGPARHDPRLDWWQQARFGMFVHWGPVSLRGTEIGWSRGDQVPAEEYDKLYRQFNPTQFNAFAWARLAKNSGMKYLVFTTKHHDGFCNWDTRQTDYNIMNTPFGRDVVRELADACRKQGVRFSMYHSICDWWHPDYPLGSPGGKTRKPGPDMDRYEAYLKAQLSELVLGYGPLGVLWFDGEWEEPWNATRGRELYEFCRGLQPSLIINNRVSVGRSGMSGITDRSVDNPGDYDTPEQEVGKYEDQHPWETCMTLCQQWAWKPNDTMKSRAECLQTLVRCAGGDGNLLFNIGPMPDGRVEPRQVKRLEEMGAWLRRYGRTIYDTRGGPWKPTESVASTRRGQRIYVHVLRPEISEVRLPALPIGVRRVYALTGGTATLATKGDDWVLRLVKSPPRVPERGGELLIHQTPVSAEHIDTIVALELDETAMDLPALPGARL